MRKCCFKVFESDKKDSPIIVQVVCNTSEMSDVLSDLSSLGVVKGYLFDDREVQDV